MAESLQPGAPNSFLQKVAEALFRARGFMPGPADSAQYRAGAPAPQNPAGELLLGQAPEEIERWAHGSSPFKSSFPGVSSRLPELQDKRKTAVVDAILAMPLGTAGKMASAATGMEPVIGAAVKAKGGMWHPEAAERLARPLVERLIPPGEVNPGLYEFIKIGRPEVEWPRKAIRTYLNRHAGTSTDPLNDVEIPFGEGTKRWEDVTDALVGSTPANRTFQNEPGGLTSRARFPNVPPDEPVWNISGAHRPGTNPTEPVSTVRRALESHLSHVGDYLRQNVPSEKLAQYDLVRAVKEADARDKLMKAQMEKAQQASMKDLPVHKDYGDGFRFVELKLPEKLTPGQLSTIREGRGAALGEQHWYQALGQDKKVIENNFTGAAAVGRTPEEAWLAGQLAQEGNAMGHCVGGYCEGVASGESRIFSLRDAKGRSHVTVEVELGRPARDTGLIGSENITQIKGKQNRAPSAEYLPYVQDFVKSGKWGEVGDLANSGLTHIKHEMNGPWGSLKPGFYTPDEFKAATGQDPRLGR